MAARSDIRQLLLQVDANVELARRALDGLDRDIGRDTASIDRSLGRIDQAMGRVTAAAGAFLSIRGVAALGKQFLDIADASKQMQAQLTLATAQFGQLGQAQQDVERIATTTRNGLSETSTLYGNFLRASQGLGKTQVDAARATETFSKALKLGGADTASAASATLQFGQALASGVLRGDEFNSIAEASPRILKLLADSLGVSTGALRGMAAEGKLTSDVLYAALTDRKFTAGIDAEFQQLPKTFGEAMVLVENAAVTTFGAFDRGGEFSTAIANFVTGGASGFKDMSDAAYSFGANVRAVMDGLGSVFDPLLDAGSTVFDLLGVKAKGLGEIIRSYVSWNLHNSQGLLNGIATPVNLFRETPLFNFADDFDRASAQSLARAADRKAQSEIRARGVAFDSQGLNIPGLTPGVLPRRQMASGGGTGGRRASATKRKPTDADLTPMQLILRDIGKQGLPIDADYQQELAALTDMDTILASIGTSSERIAQYEGAIGKLLSQEDQKRFEEFGQYFAEDMARGLADAIVYADSLGDALSNAFKRAAASLLESGILELINPGGQGGSLFRGFLSTAGSLFGGFRAGGGPVSAGRAYVVGERRPELFVPSVPGMIVPNIPQMMAAGGGGGVLRVEVDKSDYFDVRVSQISTPIASAAGMRGAVGGAVMAEQRANRRARNALR